MKVIIKIKAPISEIEIQGSNNNLTTDTLILYQENVNKNFRIAEKKEINTISQPPKTGSLTEYVLNCLPHDGMINRKVFSRKIKIESSKLKSVLIYLRSTGRIEYEPLYSRQIHVKKLGGVE